MDSTTEDRIIVTPTPVEQEAERRFIYGGFRDRDVRVLLGLRARQLAAAEACWLWASDAGGEGCRSEGLTTVRGWPGMVRRVKP